MLKYIVETINSDFVDLGSPSYVCINKSFDAPADDLSVNFPLKKFVDEIKNIKVYNEKNEKVFSGPVDVQKFYFNTSFSYLSLEARNKVAFLLDNEASPQVYSLPSLSIIFKRHIMPYGFTGFKGNDDSFSKEFTVDKGMNEWEVIKTFCVNYLNVYPRFIEDKILDATGENKKEKVVFSNEVKGNNYVKYSSICESIKRYKQYSELYIKTEDNPTYSLIVKNESAIKKGIIKKRYLSISETSITPIAYGEKILNMSNKSALELVLHCPGNINLSVGDLAVIKDSQFENLNEDFLIYKTQYVLNNNKEETIVTLIKKEV